MSDYNSSLPIRTENNGDAVVKITDGTITSQLLKIAADGSVAITDNGGSLTVDGTVELGATTLAALENITVTATDLDIRNLVFATDKVDVGGSVVALDATTLTALENVTVQNAAGASAVNIQDGGNSLTVDATNLNIRDLIPSRDAVKISDGTDSLAINADGSLNVVISDSTPGTAVSDFNTSVSVAGGASSTHTFTSTGNFNLTQVTASGTGKMKVEIRVNAVTKCVLFNSTANPNMLLELSQPIVATTGQTVTVVRTNREGQAQDVYSTIIGYTI